MTGQGTGTGWDSVLIIPDARVPRDSFIITTTPATGQKHWAAERFTQPPQETTTMPTPIEYAVTPEEREALRVDLALILTAHPGYTWKDNGGPATGSKLVCDGPECDWEMQCIGTSGTQRRALHPAHVTRLLEARVLEFADMLRARQETEDHQMHMIYRPEVAAEIAVHLSEESDWDAIAEWCGGTIHATQAGDSGEYDSCIVIPGVQQGAGPGDWITLDHAGVFRVRFHLTGPEGNPGPQS